jgi:hypothetical protein
LIASTVACSADRHARRDDADVAAEAIPPASETRTGVPILMDIPIFGVLFRSQSTVR